MGLCRSNISHLLWQLSVIQFFNSEVYAFCVFFCDCGNGLKFLIKCDHLINQSANQSINLLLTKFDCGLQIRFHCFLVDLWLFWHETPCGTSIQSCLNVHFSGPEGWKTDWCAHALRKWNLVLTASNLFPKALEGTTEAGTKRRIGPFFGTKFSMSYMDSLRYTVECFRKKMLE